MSDSPTELTSLINQIEKELGNANNGLPEELFLFLSRINPLVNVDLLIQDKRKRTLLTWREDSHYGPGWHIPGGIIRYKESAENRIKEVSRLELGAEVEFDSSPIFVMQSIEKGKSDRAHFISLLYRCRLRGEPDEELKANGDAPLPGQWAWHSCYPENLIVEQMDYAAFIGKPKRRSRFYKSLTNHLPPGQLFRYLLVGFVNTAFAYGSFALFTAFLDKYIPASYMAGSLLSSLLNITVSFLNYKWFVFKTKGNYLREWFRCLMVYSGSIVLGLILLPPTVLLVTHATDDPKSAPYIAGALLTVFNVIISFVGHKNFSFRNAKTEV